MVTRRYGAPLLRGVLTTCLAPRRGEDAAMSWRNGRLTPVGREAGAQLNRLVGLAAQGIITRHEFTAAKACVLRHEPWW